MAEGAGMAGAMSGAGIGSKVGGLIGSAANAILPGAGMIGKIGGGLIGAGIGAIGGNVKQKKSESSQNIADVDPNQQRRLAELNMISKNISSGTDALTQNKISEMNKLGSQTQNAISKVSGGDVGATTQGLLQAQRNTQSGVNDALANRSMLPAFQGLSGSVANGIAQRKLELALLNRGQQTAEYAQGRKNNNLNMMGMLGSQGGMNILDLLGPQGGYANALESFMGSRNTALANQGDIGIEGTDSAPIMNTGAEMITPSTGALGSGGVA